MWTCNLFNFTPRASKPFRLDDLTSWTKVPFAFHFLRDKGGERVLYIVMLPHLSDISKIEVQDGDRYKLKVNTKKSAKKRNYITMFGNPFAPFHSALFPWEVENKNWRVEKLRTSICIKEKHSRFCLHQPCSVSHLNSMPPWRHLVFQVNGNVIAHQGWFTRGCSNVVTVVQKQFFVMDAAFIYFFPLI